MPPKPTRKPAPKLPPNMAVLSIELLAQGATEAPTEFRIFRKGHNDSTKGVYKFTEASADRVMKKAREYGNDLSIDYGHGMFALFTVDPAEAGKAAGWFKPEVRDGELWATKVGWTKKARAMLEEREYRYISPAFDYDNAGEIQVLHNVALTNIPAIHDLEPLVASRAGATHEAPDEDEERDMNWKQFLALLNLNADTATEPEAMAALARIQGPLTELLSITGKPSGAEALAVVKAWKVAADSVPAMHAELSQIKQTQEASELQSLIDDGKRRGVVPPSYEPVLKTMGLSAAKEFLKVAVPVMSPKGREAGAGSTVQPAETELTPQQLSVAQTMGISAEEMVKRMRARNGQVPIEQPKKKDDAAA